jgi:hypothetical protein
MTDIMKNLSLNELADLECLTGRSINICLNNDLLDLKTIIDFYRRNHVFKKLRNCGEQSNKELIELCLKYEMKTLDPENVIIITDLYNTENFTVQQNQLLENQIFSLKNKLSLRILNALHADLGNEINYKSIKPILNLPEEAFKNMRNIGTKSSKEILDFAQAVKEQIVLISHFETAEITSFEVFKSLITITFSLNPSIFEEICKDYDFSNGIPIFRTLKVFIDNDILFDKVEKLIFYSYFNYHNEITSITLEEIASKCNVTRERIRQKKQKLFEKKLRRFSFLNYLEFEALNLYGIDTNCAIIEITDEIVDRINKNETTAFNALFINKILSFVLGDKYSLIGNENSLVSKRRVGSQYKWKSTYLIHRDLTNKFDFESLVEDVGTRLSKKTTTELSFPFETYLQVFAHKDCPVIIENFTRTAEFILHKEFGSIIFSGETIVFKRNIKKQE